MTTTSYRSSIAPALVALLAIGCTRAPVSPVDTTPPTDTAPTDTAAPSPTADTARPVDTDPPVDTAASVMLSPIGGNSWELKPIWIS